MYLQVHYRVHIDIHANIKNLHVILVINYD